MPISSVRLFDGMYDGLEQILDLRSRQHALTAANLANSDTPHFKAREIDFDQLLTEVMDRAMDPGLDGMGGNLMREADIPVEEIEAPPWARDGNSVNPEREMAKMTSNSVMYNGVATGLNKRLSILRFAASDGKF